MPAKQKRAKHDEPATPDPYEERPIAEWPRAELRSGLALARAWVRTMRRRERAILRELRRRDEASGGPVRKHIPGRSIAALCARSDDEQGKGTPPGASDVQNAPVTVSRITHAQKGMTR